jgi:hypothetical protein
MKQTFLLIIGGMCLIALCGYGVWLLIDAFITIFRDWRLGREVRELEEMSRDKSADEVAGSTD